MDSSVTKERKKIRANVSDRLKIIELREKSFN